MKPCTEVMADHRTVRAYDRKATLPEAHVETMLRLAQRASTDATAQLYSIVRVRDLHLRQRIADLAGGQRHILDAQEFFVFLVDVYRVSRLLMFRGEEPGTYPHLAFLFGAVDASLAAQNLALAAESLGYGVAFIGGIQNHPRELCDLLGLPPGVLPLVGLCVGVPVHRPSLRPRLPLDAVVHEDRYRPPDRHQLAAMFEAMAPVSSSGDWLDVLRRYFARGGVMERREEAFRRVWEEQLKNGSTGRA